MGVAVTVIVYMVCFLAAVFIALLWVIDMVTRVDYLKEKFPWLGWAERPKWQGPLLLVCICLLIADGYEFINKEFPNIEPPHVTFSSADPGVKNALIAQGEQTIAALRAGLNKQGSTSPTVKLTGANNISQIGGSHNSAVINPHTIQTLIVEATASCDPKPGAEKPVIEQGFVTMSRGLGDQHHALLSGNRTTLELLPQSPLIHTIESSGRRSVTETFSLSSSSPLLSKPLNVLEMLNTLTFSMMPEGFGEGQCAVLKELKASVLVNGEVAFKFATSTNVALPDGKGPGYTGVQMTDFATNVRILAMK
jgi:hypothetical protein